MKIKHRGKTLQIPIKKTNFFSRISGLMFRTKNTKNLYFEFPSYEFAGIHSYFVFFKFLALWLDESNNVVDFQIVRPFTFLIKPNSPSKKLIELPLNVRNKKIIETIVGKGKV
jgi:uncharacterized membrane protein (UPF0127 family)